MSVDACFTAEQNPGNPKNLEKPGKNSGTFLTKVTSIRYAAKRRDNVPCFPQTRYSPFIPSFLFLWRSHSFFRGRGRRSSLNGNGDGDGEVLEIGHADIEGAEAQQFGAAFRVAVQAHRGATAAQLHNLHFAPGHAVNAGTQRLADGLFGSETACQPLRLAPALPRLNLSEDAL